MSVLAAVFNLNHPAHTVDWNFIHLSVSNVVVIGLMLVVFVLALAVVVVGWAVFGRGASAVELGRRRADEVDGQFA